MSVSPTENETGAAPETVSPPSESQTTDVNIAESSSADEGAEQGSLLDAVKAALEPAAEQPPGSIGQEEDRSEEHTSELQSLMRISYAVFCLKKKTTKRNCIRRTTSSRM